MICKFLNESYTAYHATANVRETLEKNGFSRLVLGENWRVEKGGSYYVTQNGSSVVAFKVGENKVFNICESHTDSPSFKVKGDLLVANGALKRLDTEKYGGGLLYSFLDRQLKVAGRVLVETETGVKQKLVVSDYNVVIPSLAIHHNPTANDSFSVNAQNDALPLFAQGNAELYKTLCDGKVLDADLYVVPASEAFFAGVEQEFLCSPRLDNLTSVFASIYALCQCAPQDIAVVACLDNEEIGSCTRQGSPMFLEKVLQQIEQSLQFSAVESTFVRENGMVLSVDNGHAVHPAHPEKSDPKCNVALNGGIVIKHNPNYATDGLSSATFKKLMKRFNVPVQDYYNRSDVRCGTTLGLATARQLQMKTCDVGLAQLAMHSACETVGARDVQLMQKVLGLFLSARICNIDDGVDIE